jgi:hypothetical protein
MQSITARLHSEISNVITMPQSLGVRAANPTETRGALFHFGFNKRNVLSICLKIFNFNSDIQRFQTTIPTWYEADSWGLSARPAS